MLLAELVPPRSNRKQRVQLDASAMLLQLTVIAEALIGMRKRRDKSGRYRRIKRDYCTTITRFPL